MIINANVHVKVQRYSLFCNQHVMSFNLEIVYYVQPVVNIIQFLVNLFL